MPSDLLSIVRLTLFGATGVICAVYAALVLATGDPTPISPWIPLLFGIGAAGAIAMTARFAGDDDAEMAYDEGYYADSHRAQRYAYWFAVALYPIFASPLANEWIGWPVGFAAMGMLTGAAFLLLSAWFDVRDRA